MVSAIMIMLYILLCYTYMLCLICKFRETMNIVYVYYTIMYYDMIQYNTI